LKRGYIRSLPLNNGDSPVKCNFQFNPAMLNQSVSQMTGVLDVMHQSPEALAVPLMGNSNFTFSLRFDRSMELNNPSNRPDTAVDLWADLDPSQVGVLRDISALYSVIGQGIKEGQSADNAIRTLS